MPNFTATDVEDAIVMWSGRMREAMNRTQFNDFVQKLSANTDIIMPEAQSIRDSDKRTIKAHIQKTIIDEDANTGRTCNIGGSYGDGVSTTLSWLQTGTAGRVSLKQHHDNTVSFQNAVQKKLTDMRQSCLRKMNNDFASYLNANASTSNEAESFGSFNGATNTFEVDPDLAEKPGFFNIADQMMKENRYMGLDGYEAIVNGYTNPWVRFQSQQGAGNQTNQAFQFGGFNITNGLGYQDANYPNWFSFLFQSGLVGVVFWTEMGYRANPLVGQNLEGTNGTKSVFPDPEIPGLTWMLKMQLKCEDTSAINGGPDDDVLAMLLTAEYSLNKAVTEDGSTPIFKIASKDQAA